MRNAENSLTGEPVQQRVLMPPDAANDDLPSEPVQARIATQEEVNRGDVSSPIDARPASAEPSSVLSPGGTALDVYEEFTAGDTPAVRATAATRRDRNYNPSMRTPVATRARTRAAHGVSNQVGNGLAVIVKTRPSTPSSYSALVSKRASSDPSNHREAMMANEEEWTRAEHKELKAHRQNESWSELDAHAICRKADASSG